MNLFRSEEHVKAWWGYKDEAKGGMLPIGKLMEVFSAPLFRERLAPDYILRYGELVADFLLRTRQITNDDPFWHRAG